MAVDPSVTRVPGTAGALAALTAGGDRGEYSASDDAAAATFTAETAVLDAIEEQASGSGLLLVLDDLHWADDASLRLLNRLAADIRRLPILIVATLRDGGQDDLSGLACVPVSRSWVPPMTDQEAEALLNTGVTDADPAAVREAASRSGGSPLYLRTLTRVGTDQLRGRADPSRSSEASEFRQLVGSALRSAGSETAEAVQVLSVLGLESPAWLVMRLLGRDPSDDLITLLQPAVPAGLVRPYRDEPNAEVGFAHALVRDVVYASLRPGRRRELHRRAAELLSPFAVGRDGWAGLVATHWERGGRLDRAVEWSVRAADAAQAAGAYADAARYLSSALAAVDPLLHGVAEGTLPVDTAELLLDLARVQYLGGDLLASLGTCEHAAAEGERRGRMDVVARAAITIQGVGHPALNLRVERLCRRALDGGDADLPGASAGPRRGPARLHVTIPTDARRRPLVGSRAAARRGSGDPDAELDAIRARAAVVSSPGFQPESSTWAGVRPSSPAQPNDHWPSSGVRSGDRIRRSTWGTSPKPCAKRTRCGLWPIGPVCRWRAGIGGAGWRASRS